MISKDLEQNKDKDAMRQMITNWLQHSITGVWKLPGLSVGKLCHFADQLKLTTTKINSLWQSPEDRSAPGILYAMGQERSYWENLAQETELEYLKIFQLDKPENKLRPTKEMPGEQAKEPSDNKLAEKPAENDSEISDRTKNKLPDLQKPLSVSVSEKTGLSMGILQTPIISNDIVDTTRPASMGRLKDNITDKSGYVTEVPAIIKIHPLGHNQKQGFVNNSNNELFEWLQLPKLNQASDSAETKQQIVQKLNALQQKMAQQQVDKIQVVVGSDNVIEQLRELRKIAGSQVNEIFAPQALVVTPKVFAKQIQQRILALPISKTDKMLANAESAENIFILNNKLRAEGKSDSSEVEFVFPQVMSDTGKNEVMQQTVVVPQLISNTDMTQANEIRVQSILPIPSGSSGTQSYQEPINSPKSILSTREKPEIGTPLIKPLEKTYLSIPNNMRTGMESQISSPRYTDKPMSLVSQNSTKDHESGNEMRTFTNVPQVLPEIYSERFKPEAQSDVGNMESLEMPGMKQMGPKEVLQARTFPSNIQPYTGSQTSTSLPDINHFHLGLNMLPANVNMPNTGQTVIGPAWQGNPYIEFPKNSSAKKQTSLKQQSPMSSLIFLATQGKAHKLQENRLADSEPQIMRRSINRAAPIQMAAKDRATGEVMDNTKVSGQEKSVYLLAQAFYAWYQNQEQLNQEQSFRSVGLWR
jgi:hypothetical protein